MKNFLLCVGIILALVLTVFLHSCRFIIHL